MGFFSDLFQYGYLANAFAACVLSGVVCALVGTYEIGRASCRERVF